MQTNDHQIRNYDIVLDETFGKPGSPERAKAEEVVEGMQEDAHHEKGIVTPSVGMFYRIIAALGMRVEIVKPIY